MNYHWKVSDFVQSKVNYNYIVIIVNTNRRIANGIGLEDFSGKYILNFSQPVQVL